jgi:hypothetical protein
MATAREQSQRDWTVGSSTPELILGCLQRIADATEKMAASYVALRNERDMYERMYREYFGANAAKQRQIASLRGVITRQKKQLAEAR